MATKIAMTPYGRHTNGDTSAAETTRRDYNGLARPETIHTTMTAAIIEAATGIIGDLNTSFVVVTRAATT